MSFLRRLFGRGGAADENLVDASGSPGGLVVVTDRRATLAEHVERLVSRPALEYLVVEWDARRRLYAQYAPVADGGLMAAIVGDRYLEPRHRLRESQRAALDALGWREDASAGNWQRRWLAGTAPEAIAADSVAAMAVYGTEPRAHWTITFGAD